MGPDSVGGTSPAASTLSAEAQRTGAPARSLDAAAHLGALAQERSRCEARIARVEGEPALRGTPELDERRVELLLTVKAEPTLFIQAPQYSLHSDPEVLEYRTALARSRAPAATIASLLRAWRSRPEAIRAVLLRDGYLYAEAVPLAQALVGSLRADLLFDAGEITIERGEQVLVARRDPALRRYVYVDGPQAGSVVSLLLFDRVQEGASSLPLHRDVRSLRYRLGFHRLRARHVAVEWLTADLEYGDVWVPTLLAARGARLELDCEAAPEGRESEVEEARQLELLRARAFAPVQRVIGEEIDEALPFDEPKHEIGQEDGHLRPLWYSAYEKGALAYTHRDEVYRVFDAAGRPLVPQVCVDFVLDTLERSAGTWWNRQGQPASRHTGRIDFAGMERGPLRRVTEFIRYAEAHPRWFHVLEVDSCEQVPLGRQVELGQYLSRHARDFRPGDVVFVAGCVPWDPLRVIHHHAFFIFEADPVTALPLALAGNAGRPRISTWSFEMRRAPARTLRFRVRPAPSWLASLTTDASPSPLGPPPLSWP